MEIYQDKRGKWRWRYVSSNGRIIAISSQGYATKQKLEESLQLLKEAFDELG